MAEGQPNCASVLRSLLLSEGESDCDSTVSCSPPGAVIILRDSAMCPWNWAERAHTVQLASPEGSPTTGAVSNGNNNTDKSGDAHQAGIRRGRPRLDSITSLILEGSTSPSTIKCRICNRVFPREKSLQAHMRTHTGERPYVCDYPRCGRSFAQSGQLKTHQRLHTGEKPFICSAEGCKHRFTHANRHCSVHPWATLQRDTSSPLQLPSSSKRKENQKEDVLAWLEKYRQKCERSRALQLKARKLMPKFEKQAELDKMEEDEDVTVAATSSDSIETDAEMLGALALIELSKSTAHYEQNSPLNLSASK